MTCFSLRVCFGLFPRSSEKIVDDRGSIPHVCAFFAFQPLFEQKPMVQPKNTKSGHFGSRTFDLWEFWIFRFLKRLAAPKAVHTQKTHPHSIDSGPFEIYSATCEPLKENPCHRSLISSRAMLRVVITSWCLLKDLGE